MITAIALRVRVLPNRLPKAQEWYPEDLWIQVLQQAGDRLIDGSRVVFMAGLEATC